MVRLLNMSRKLESTFLDLNKIQAFYFCPWFLHYNGEINLPKDPVFVAISECIKDAFIVEMRSDAFPDIKQLKLRWGRILRSMLPQGQTRKINTIILELLNAINKYQEIIYNVGYRAVAYDFNVYFDTQFGQYSDQVLAIITNGLDVAPVIVDEFPVPIERSLKGRYAAVAISKQSGFRVSKYVVFKVNIQYGLSIRCHVVDISEKAILAAQKELTEIALVIKNRLLPPNVYNCHKCQLNNICDKNNQG